MNEIRSEENKDRETEKAKRNPIKNFQNKISAHWKQHIALQSEAKLGMEENRRKKTEKIHHSRKWT